MTQAANALPDALTADIIEFLTQPGSDYGTQPDDIASLQTPEALAAQIRLRLEIPTTSTEEVERQQLRDRLRESDLRNVDWSVVTQELRLRLRLTDGFFAQDLPTHQSAS